jgi:outer membrane protein assembly factor BamA
MKIRLFLFPFFFLLSLRLSAQDSTVVKPVKKMGVLPVPTFGFAPETRLYGGIVALFTLRHWADSLTRVSTAKAEVSYTQNRQFIFETGVNLFTPWEKWNIEATASWRRFPEFWWGLGNSSPDSAKELYDAKRVEADLRVSRQVGHHLFAGLRYRMQAMYQIEADSGILSGKTGVPGSGGGFYSGLGPSFSYDSRKNVLNAREGWYIHCSALGFGRLTGSQLPFWRMEMDVRKYLPVRQGKDVLAFQAYSLLHPGDPPFRLMSLLGSDREMRGYYQGRYRDQYYAAMQAEYRLKLFWRLGAVAFAGGGNVWGKWSGNPGFAVKPSVGGGLRFLMDKKDNVNLRIDFAVGQRTTGFYVGFGEAF